MRKLRWLLSPPTSQPDPASPTVASPIQRPAPTSPPHQIGNPPSYDQDQIDRLRDELQQVRLQLSEVQLSRSSDPDDRLRDELRQVQLQLSEVQQSRPSDPELSTAQVSHLAPYIAEEVPNYAPSQAKQAQHQEKRNKNSSRLEEADAIALLLENGWDSASWEPSCNQEERNRALYWAATNGHVAAVQYLVENGASGMSKAVGVDWGVRQKKLRTGKCRQGQSRSSRTDSHGAASDGGKPSK